MKCRGDPLVWTFFASVTFSGTPSSFLSRPLFSLIGKFASSKALWPRIWRALNSNGVISVPRSAVFLITPLPFKANFTSNITFCFLAALLSLPADFLLWLLTLLKWHHFTGRQGGGTATRFAVCVWTGHGGTATSPWQTEEGAWQVTAKGQFWHSDPWAEELAATFVFYVINHS